MKIDQALRLAPSGSRGRALSILLVAQIALAACSSPAAPSPTAKPAAPAAPASPAASAAASPDAKPAASPAASPSASPAAQAQAKPSAAPDPAFASIWAGKVFTMVISEAPGGAADATARLVGTHLVKHLPGTPTFVPQNMPGANSRIAANSLYTTKGDGLTVGMVNSGVPAFQLAGEGVEQGVRYDVTKFQWIGSPTVQTQALVLHQKVGVTVQTLDQLKTKTVTLAGQSPGETTQMVSVLLNHALGWKLKTVFGYQGLPGRILGIDRGEVDGLVATWDGVPLIKGDDLRSKILLPLVIAGREKDDPLLAGVPNAERLFANSTPESREMLALVTRPYEFARPFLAPPETPANIVAGLRAAFDATMADPDFQNEAKRLQIDVLPVSGERMQAGMAEYLKSSRETVDKLQALVDAEATQ